MLDAVRGKPRGRRTWLRVAVGSGAVLALALGHALSGEHGTRSQERTHLERARTLRGRARRVTGPVRQDLVDRACAELEIAWDQAPLGPDSDQELGAASLATAALCAASGRFDTARSWLARLETCVDPEWILRGRLQCAHLHRREERFEEAHEVYAQLAVDPRAPPGLRDDALHGSASMNAALGFLEAAERTWSGLLRRAHAPGMRVNSWVNIARIARADGRSDEVKSLRDALRVDLVRASQGGDERARHALMRLDRW